MLCRCSSFVWISSLFLGIHGLVIEKFRLSPFVPSVPSEGLLEAKVNGTWGAVRNNRYNWRDPLDDLVCRTFGYVNESVLMPYLNSNSTPLAAFTIQGCPDYMTSLQMINTSCKIIPGQPQSDYDNIYKTINCKPLQLVDGPSPLEGRLEVGLFGRLQSVCGLGFDNNAAHVACKSLGYSGVRSFSTITKFGAGTLPLNNRTIQCNGTELSLELCDHSVDNAASCTPNDVVSVDCIGGPLKLVQVLGNRTYEGILVGYHDNIWYDVVGHVSGTTAKTLCSILGYGHVGFATRAHPGKNLYYYKENVDCQGLEKYIEECRGELKYCVEKRYNHCTHQSYVLTHVALFCSDYTLESISLSATGVLQVGVNGQTWMVCDAYFTKETANTVCNLLGFNGTGSFERKPTIDELYTEILGSIICKPKARSFIDCQIKHVFSYRPYDRSAACRNYIMLTCDGGLVIDKFRLSPFVPSVPSEGLLEARVNGTWGAVRYMSRYNWRDPLDDLVCRTFGYVKESVMQPQYHETPLAALTIDHCLKDMTSLRSLSTFCNVKPGHPHSDYDYLSKTINCEPLQLVDGPSQLEGRLEVGLIGRLQSVCGRGFDNKAANVTCTSLGYSGVQSFYTSTKFDTGNLPLYNRTIQCNGTELSLELCHHSVDNAASCTSNDVVSVACIGGPLKLEQVMGNQTYEGILVGYHDKIWYDVVGQVSKNTSKTLCSILGYGHVGFATRAHPGKNLYYYKENVECQGHEKYTEECRGELKYCVSQGYGYCIYQSDFHTHVALFCSDYILDSISLSATGVLHVGVNGQTWMVCDAYFTNETAITVCNALGFNGTGSFEVNTSVDESYTEILGSVMCKPNARSVMDCHIKHQFSYRPYHRLDACKDYVVLTCNWRKPFDGVISKSNI